MPSIGRFFPSTGISSWSGGKFGGGASAPGAPGTLALSNGPDSLTEITLNWSVGTSGSETVTGYHIEVSTDNSSWSDISANTSSVSTTYTHSSIANNTQRWYRVSSINANGEGDASNAPNHTTGVAVGHSQSGDPVIRTYTASGVAYKSLQYFSSGTFVLSSIPSGKTFDILVVSGGGGGGTGGSYNNYANPGGGGGGGGARAWSSETLSAQSYTVTIGSGGSGKNGSEGNYMGTNGSAGSASSFGSYSTTGGGYGSNWTTGGSGGSGGGGGGGSTFGGGSGTTNEGNSGGMGNAPYGASGGGGGGGGAGQNGAVYCGGYGSGGGGGAGLTNIYTNGMSYANAIAFFGGGGGGSGYGGATCRAGGAGGGQGGYRGASHNGPTGGDATSGTGSGGGGGGQGKWGGNGASGCVVVRWAI